jgi:histidinol phosphatase-like enzyme
MKIVIDIDGTLCDEESSEITQRRPYLDRIAKLNQMYDAGDEVVIYTSRGMRSTEDDPAASDRKYRSITEIQLKAWGVKYDKLMFGKPNADVYIDNKNGLIEEFFK